jgi:F0F1-type ATP synthase assembly protein I
MASGGKHGEAWSGVGEAWAVIGTLFSGLLVWGGVGLLVDRLTGFRWLFLPVGMLVGIGTSIYLVYMRYGRQAP